MTKMVLAASFLIVVLAAEGGNAIPAGMGEVAPGLTCEVGRFIKGDFWNFSFSEEVCSDNFDACETKLEVHSGRHIVTKSCGHESSCRTNELGNIARCNTTDDAYAGDFLCFLCCTTDSCNKYEFVPEEDHGEVVILRRNGTISFDRDWDEYKAGFGDTVYEFFVGLQYLHELTTFYDDCLLEVCYDDCSTTDFSLVGVTIDDEDNNYALSFTSRILTGGQTAREAFDFVRRHTPVSFSTYDDDNDNSGSNCADTSDGGWWYDTTCTGPTGTWGPLNRNKIELTLDCGNQL